MSKNYMSDLLSKYGKNNSKPKDISYCCSDCTYENCERHKSHVQITDIVSFVDFTGECQAYMPKKLESEVCQE